MSKGIFEIKGYNSYSGCDIIVTARLSNIVGHKYHEKVYSLGALQTLSVSTHQDKKPVRAIGNINALDYTLGQRTIAGSCVFAVFDRNFADAIFTDLKEITGKTIILPDELPALDFTITFANEYGRTSRMALYGVKFVNEGQVMSINDIYTENTYQFVATSLEPLTADTTNGSGVTDKNKEKNIIMEEQKNKVVRPGQEITDNIYKENNIGDLEKVKLEVEIENSIVTNNGFAKFKLTPKQTSGAINILSGDTVDTLDLINYQGQSIYCIELNSGSYTAQYISEDTLSYSNIVSFTINAFNSYNKERNDMPIIENISHNSISIISNSPSHTHVEVSSNKFKYTTILELKNKKCLISNLIPSTNYQIRTITSDKDNASEIVSAQTYSYMNEDIDLFINFVKHNSNLLISQYEKYNEILELLYNIKQKSIIDKLLMVPNTFNKDIIIELMLYAVKYQNQLNVLYNKNNSTKPPKKIISSAFWNELRHDVSSVKSNMFYTNKGKSYFDSSIIYPSQEIYNGISNKHYYLYDVNDNNSRSANVDMIFFNDKEKDLLSSYKKVNVLNDLDIDDNAINNTYKSISLDYKKAIKSRDNKIPNINLLEGPFIITYDEDMLTLDVNYMDLLKSNAKDYYVCISIAEEALDYTPFNKVKFKGTQDKLILNNYKTGITKDNIYLIWIEDDNNKVISSSTIVSTYDNIDELLYINSIDINKLIEKERNYLNIIFPNYKDLIDTVYSLVSSSSISAKSLNHTLQQELITYGTDNSTTMNILFEAIKFNFNKRYKKMHSNVTYNKSDSTIAFNNKDEKSYMSIVEYKTYEDYPLLDNQNSDVYKLNNELSYTLMYLIDETLLFTSGFVLINNQTNEVLTYNLECEVI